MRKLRIKEYSSYLISSYKQHILDSKKTLLLKTLFSSLYMLPFHGTLHFLSTSICGCCDVVRLTLQHGLQLITTFLLLKALQKTESLFPFGRTNGQYQGSSCYQKANYSISQVTANLSLCMC